MLQAAICSQTASWGRVTSSWSVMASSSARASAKRRPRQQEGERRPPGGAALVGGDLGAVGFEQLGQLVVGAPLDRQPVLLGGARHEGEVRVAGPFAEGDDIGQGRPGVQVAAVEEGTHHRPDGGVRRWRGSPEALARAA